MAEFDELREQLDRARNDRDAAGDDVLLARERLKRIATRESELNRIFNQDDQAHIAERRLLEQERERIRANLTNSSERHKRAKLAESDLFGRFATLTDPTNAIQNFNDNLPILMMPVRLETRFKTIAVTGAAPANQLWVRIFPDDCWIDSFDPLLTETEVENARTYWIGIWKAGGIEDQERGAWTTLAGGHGSGRAGWIISQFEPANIAAKPSKPRPQDVILTIAIDTPLPSVAEAPAVATFWREVWLADGDTTRVGVAQTALETALGQDPAREVISKYQPINFTDRLPTGVTKDEVNVSVALIVFPTVETKQGSWARAPRVNILPDRFVFLGYEGGKQTKIEVGNPIVSPLIVGPDPSAAKEDQIQPDKDGNLVIPEEMKWMTDFNRAVEVGMGFRINLNATQATNGFSRVLVIGLRFSADEQKAKSELENLFTHHSLSRKGLAVVPQGTPTNNTEAAASGFDRLDNPDQSFNDRKAPLFTPETGWLDKKDGQWIAEYLGIDPALFQKIPNAGGTDQLTERAMNIALWPATFGYWMESMMSPVFTRNGVEQTRDFFNRYVLGAGSIPAIRIGSQPYGILPATTISRMSWLTDRESRPIDRLQQDSLFTYLQRLYPLLKNIDDDWKKMLDDVSFVGKPGDPHHLLLDIVGLHPGSVEWAHRYAESLKTLFNRLNLIGIGGFLESFIRAQRSAALDLIRFLSGKKDVDPKIFEKVFSGRHSELKGGVVDDRPLSETEQIRAYTVTNQNYVQWLIDAAQTSFDALYSQTGFKDDKPPTALLFLLLRHALQLGYHDVSIRVNENAGILTAEAATKARIDDPFLHIRDNREVSESRYQTLYAVAPAITGSPTQTVHQFITAGLKSLSFAFYLREQLAALERLKTRTTAQLERAFADHIDCCSYRLDAWLLGIVKFQLDAMRNIREQSDAPVRQGIYLGAYAWLEDLKPENKVLKPVTLSDPDLIKDFVDEKLPPLVSDATNQGYVHAPSLNHAVAAAVLRNGFISNASSANRQTMAVNLTSERVRTALALLEGIRAGQGLTDLLGYQFERGLHDRHNLAEVDQFIFKLRKAFPLRADRMKSTKTVEGVSIEAIEARNVIDGLALAEHIKATGNKTYPFGKTGLPPASAAQSVAINAEADRLIESADAVADLALSEGVYQAVLGNYDRVASTYDAYARGNFPPEPDIIRTPLNGIGVTHRVGLHLTAGADPNVSPIATLNMTARAQAEPALNDWLSRILPPLDQIGCVVAFKRASDGQDRTEPVTLRNLDLQPADIVAIVQDANEQAMAELDDRLVRHAMKNFGPRPDVPVTIRYMESAAVSIFQLIPLVRNIRKVTTKSRALKATDLALTNEAAAEDDGQTFVDIQRFQLVRSDMEVLRGELFAFQGQVEAPLSDLDNRKNEILANADQYVDDVVDLLARAATFVVAQAGWGFAYDFKRRAFTAMLKQAFDPPPAPPGETKTDLVSRWNEKEAEFNALLVLENNLPGTATDEERFGLLTQAERAISTVMTNPLPATPAAYRNDLVNVKLTAFTAKRDQFADLRNTTKTKVFDLLNDVKALLPITDFDSVEYSVAAHENQMVVFAQDAVAVVKVVIAELDRRLSRSLELFNEHGAEADPAKKTALLEEAARVLLGSDFRIFPEFTPAADAGAEIENALAASRSGELFTYLTAPPAASNLAADPFPVDTWLYGVARVRDKVHAWEQLVMFAGSLGRPVADIDEIRRESELDAMQLPFVAGDRWLGLEFPPEQKLDHDRLLYTAANLPLAFNKAAPQCGLLVDEWTEIIPTADVDTGITFHHDRPNSEAPQAMLLVTPSSFRGSWQWDDLVDALIETLVFSKRRAIEPRQLDRSAYAPLLPATIMVSQVSQLTIAANLAINNKVAQVIQKP